MSRSERRIEIKVGLFLNLGILLLLIGTWLAGGTQRLFGGENAYTLLLPSAEGLVRGSKVLISGVNAGTVDSFELDPEAGGVKVRINVSRKFEKAIHRDSTATVASEGVLGDRIVSLTQGSRGQPVLPPGHEIHVRTAPNINQILSKSDQLLGRLNQIAQDVDRILENISSRDKTATLFREMTSAAQNISSLARNLDRELDGIQLKSAVKNLNSILTKIDHGHGTLSGLINDPALYDDTKALIGEANDNRIVRNLVRKTIRDSEEQRNQQDQDQQQAGSTGK